MKRWTRLATCAVVALVGVGVVIGLRSSSAPPVAGPTASTTAPSPAGSPAPAGPTPQTVAPGEASTDAVAPVDPGPDALLPDFDVLAPVALTDQAVFGDGVTATLVAIEAVEPHASGPGESQKPGLAVTVDLTNGTPSTISLDAVVVDLYGADGAPGVQYLADPRADTFEGALAPGASARATYVVAVTDVTNDITVTVSYEPGKPAVSFTGKA